MARLAHYYGQTANDSGKIGGLSDSVSRRVSARPEENGRERSMAFGFLEPRPGFETPDLNPKDDLLFHRRNTCAERSTRTLSDRSVVGLFRLLAIHRDEDASREPSIPGQSH